LKGRHFYGELWAALPLATQLTTCVIWTQAPSCVARV